MGRKPKNDKPMTSAEKMRLHRMKKKADGETQITMNFPVTTLRQIDELTDFFGLPNRAMAMEQLLKRPLLEALETMNAAYDLIEKVTDEDDRKAIMDVKSIIWKSICLNEPLLGEALLRTLQRHFGGNDDR